MLANSFYIKSMYKRPQRQNQEQEGKASSREAGLDGEQEAIEGQKSQGNTSQDEQ